MAPGRGAWGYFASSRGEMTQQDIDRERYYIAVQTFLSPGYMDHTREFAQFFKYRIKELPVRWVNNPYSHAKLPAYLQIFWETIKIRWNIIRKKYKNS